MEHRTNPTGGAESRPPSPSPDTLRLRRLAAVDWENLRRRMVRRSALHGDDAVQSVAEKILLGRFDHHRVADMRPLAEQSAKNALTDLQRREARRPSLPLDTLDGADAAPAFSHRGFEDDLDLAVALDSVVAEAEGSALLLAALIRDSDLPLAEAATAAGLNRSEAYRRLRHLRAECADLDPRRPSRREHRGGATNEDLRSSLSKPLAALDES